MILRNNIWAETTNENKVKVTSNMVQKYYLVNINTPPFKTPNIFHLPSKTQFGALFTPKLSSMSPIIFQSLQFDHPQILCWL